MFILMLHLTPDQISPILADYLKVILNEFKVVQSEFEKFLDGLNDSDLLFAYRNIMPMLYK